MELNKKKYTHKEVQLIFDAYKTEYNKRFTDLKDRIADLTKQNNTLRAEFFALKEKEDLILAVLERAEQTAQEVKAQSEAEYKLELERLRSFSETWDTYFQKLMEKYPTSVNIKKAINIKNKAKNPSKIKSAKQTVAELEQMISPSSKKADSADKHADAVVKEKFDPKQKLGEYIVATEDGGFNMEEVLNPGELKLEDICKELGLIDE